MFCAVKANVYKSVSICKVQPLLLISFLSHWEVVMLY